MRQLSLVALDLLLIGVATVVAIALRFDFQLSAAILTAHAPYFLASLAAAAIVLPVSGSARMVWRMMGLADCARLSAIVGTVVMGAVALAFAYNRLDGIPRSLPALQALVSLFALVGARILARLQHVARTRAVRPGDSTTALGSETALVIGLNSLTEMYLLAADRLARGQIEIAGVLACDAREAGRSVLQRPILGTAGDVDRVLKDLDLRGVKLARIVVTVAWTDLPPAARRVLRDVQRGGDTQVFFIDEMMGFRTPKDILVRGAPQDAATDRRSAPPIPTRRIYWPVKRAVDVIVALALIILLAPVMLLVTGLVLVDVGMPVMFWQQRPGLGGRPFRLRKFRTMGPAYDAQGRRLTDPERSSPIGRFLRRSRLDELPQLFHVLLGEMSLVGPRPLLVTDQSPDSEARLLVRPGLTGWAQINGGRHVRQADKAALDIWYVHNASFALDLAIMARTLPVLAFGDRLNCKGIERSWRDLRRRGIFDEDSHKPVRPALAMPVVADAASISRRVA